MNSNGYVDVNALVNNSNRDENGEWIDKGFRRFITAQTMRAMESNKGYIDYVRKHYEFGYQFDFLEREYNWLRHAARDNDQTLFEERRGFFDWKTVLGIYDALLSDIKTFIANRNVKTSKKYGEYIVIRYVGRFSLDTDYKNPTRYPKIMNIFQMLERQLHSENVQHMKNIDSQYKFIKSFNRNIKGVIKVNHLYELTINDAFLDAFAAEGVYYTLQNLVRFHGVKVLFEDGTEATKEQEEMMFELVHNVKVAKTEVKALKHLCERNNFNFRESLERKRNTEAIA